MIISEDGERPDPVKVEALTSSFICMKQSDRELQSALLGADNICKKYKQ